MQGIAQAFSEGGPFMYFILLMGLALTVLTIIQFFLARRSDMSPLLWGMLAGLVFLGALASVMGMIQMFSALEYVAPDMRTALMARGISIAINTTALALFFAIPLSVMIGVASFLVKRAWRRQLSKGGF